MSAPVYVLLGPPGSGKGTQAERLEEAIGAFSLSTGELLRGAIEAGTEVGKLVDETMAAGKLVPTDLLVPLLEEAISTIPGEQPILLDGFPRTLRQAKELDSLLSRQNRALERVFLLDVSREELLERLLGRGREDDTVDTIRERMEVYEEETLPLREHYRGRGLLSVVQGEGSPEQVSKRLLTLLAPGAG